MAVAAALPQYENVKSGLFKKKASLVPPLPDTIIDIEIKGSWSK
jgi:hypothetical protein